MRYVVYFTRAGAPETGLSPTFDVFVNAATGGALAGPTVTELAGGLYTFEYAPAVVIAGRIDSNDGTMANADRYIFMTLSPADDVGASLISTPIASYQAQSGTLAYILHALFRRAFGRARKSGDNIVVYDDDGSTVLFTIPVSSEEWGPPS